MPQKTLDDSVDYIDQRVRVDFDYPVIFCRRLFFPENPLLAQVLDRRHEKRRHRILVFIDSGLLKAMPGFLADVRQWFLHWGSVVLLVDDPLVISGGEEAKQGRAGVEHCIEAIARYRMDRQSAVIGIGGGALLDVVGLAASLVHRGLRMIRIPTTVVAQNDVGVGVKTGIDAWDSKNYIGTFAPPFAVINDFDFLDTLDDADWRSGASEAFKVAIIKDRSFFDFLNNSAEYIRKRDKPPMEKLIRRCAELHLEHIRTSGDPFEMGTARPLDFGHWSAHHLEVLSGFTLNHGLAVSIGIALDSCYAALLGKLTNDECEEVLSALHRTGLPLWNKGLDQRNRSGERDIYEGLRLFQEHLGGELTITLPDGIGSRCEVHTMDIALLEKALAQLKTTAHSFVVPGE